MPKTNRDIAFLAAAIALLGLQTGCVYSLDRIGQGEASSVSGAPAISSFVATPPIITLGSTAQLKCVFTAGTGMITPGNLPVSSGGVVEVAPAATILYTLTVSNPSGAQATRIATVTVMPLASAVISADLVEASGAEQTAAGNAIANGAIVGEPMAATVSSAAGLAIEVRQAFLPPDPSSAN